MKLFFWILLIANTLFFAFIWWGDALLEDASSSRLQQLLNAQKITLRATPPEMPAISAPPSTVIPASVEPPAPDNDSPISNSLCLEWGEFSGIDLVSALKALNSIEIGNEITQRQVEHEIGYWVYMPPRRTRTQVDKKISELKALDVNEFFVVREPGEWLNSISLGVFTTEEAAQNFLGKLRKKGVRTARVGKRASKHVLTSFIINNPDAKLTAKLEDLKNDFHDSKLKTVTCSQP